MNKACQNMKKEMESIKKTYIQGHLEIKNLGAQTETAEVSLSYSVQEMEDIILGIEDIIQEIHILVKKW